MAIPAILAKFSLVLVLVTAGAIVKENPAKSLIFFTLQGFYFMALDAFHHLVFSCQGEFRLLVIKFHRRLKGIHAMTVCAGGRQGFSVIVIMAGEAFGVQSQVSKGLLPDIRIQDKVRLMAAFAFLLKVGPGQIKTCKGMVETFGFKIDDPEGESMVVTVTGGAFFAPDLRRGMVAFLESNPGLQFNMAFQAFVVRNFGSEGMAPGAV